MNHNGKIDSGAELFGSATRLPNGERAANGFEALKALDGNGDGRITPADASWSELRLWLDRDRDAVSQRRELFPLDAYGISALRTDYLEVKETDLNGNETRQRSLFYMRDRGKLVPRVMADIWFLTFLPW